MAKKQKDPIVLNHDGKEYTEAELRENPEAFKAYSHLVNINRKLENSVFNHDELMASKKSFDSDLNKALKEPEEAEVVES
jgi:hypothetical protein|tara:strand:- start:2189 stop:2428 length:240 start_codon:yes stop_codon:yes gene_type:complete